MFDEYRGSKLSEMKLQDNNEAMRELKDEFLQSELYNSDSSSSESESDSDEDDEQKLESEKQRVKDYNRSQNEFVVHELMTNPEFKLKKQQENPLAETMKRAFWDSFKTELQLTPKPNLSRVASLVQEIRDEWIAILPKRAQQLMDHLDIDLLKQQIERETVFLPEYLQYLNKLLIETCSPIRDKQIKQWVKKVEDNFQPSTDNSNRSSSSAETYQQKALLLLPQYFKEYFDELEQLKLDIANYKLQSLKPYLSVHGAKYQRSQFNKPHSLDITTEWLNSTLSNMNERKDTILSSDSSGDTEDKDSNTITPKARHTHGSFAIIVLHGLLDLLNDNLHSAIQPEKIPELFKYDVQNVLSFQNDIQTITLVASMILLTRQHNQDMNNTELELLKNVLFDELRKPDTVIETLKQKMLSFIMKNKKSVSSNEASETTQISNDQTKAKSTVANETQASVDWIDKAVSVKNPVYSLLAKRVLLQLRNEATEIEWKQVEGGLKIVIAEIRSLVQKLQVFVAKNYKIFQPIYTTLLNTYFQGKDKKLTDQNMS